MDAKTLLARIPVAVDDVFDDDVVYDHDFDDFKMMDAKTLLAHLDDFKRVVPAPESADEGDRIEDMVYVPELDEIVFLKRVSLTRLMPMVLDPESGDLVEFQLPAGVSLR